MGTTGTLLGRTGLEITPLLVWNNYSYVKHRKNMFLYTHPPTLYTESVQYVYAVISTEMHQYGNYG